MATIQSIRGNAVLMISHVAGMIDLVALPVWIGVLVQHYKLNFERAGLTVTLFLVGVVVASIVLAPLFTIISQRVCVIVGYVIAACAFYATAHTTDPTSILVAHVIAGLGAGCSLSITHGAIGRSLNPHRLFAGAGVALGVFAVAFYAIVPQIIAKTDGSSLFLVLGALMLSAAIASLGFPLVFSSKEEQQGLRKKIPSAAWFAIAGIVCMALNQAMIFSFLEQIGITRGFGESRVHMVLAILGIVNLFPAALAGVLQKKISATTVASIAPLVQAALAVVISSSTIFFPYAFAACLYAFVMIFTHTFLFGLLAHLDRSGRAVASTPAMLMVGSAVAPALAGVVAQRIGFYGLGVAATVVAVVAIICFLNVARVMRQPSALDGSVRANSATTT